jgi:hypothetical protein
MEPCALADFLMRVASVTSSASFLLLRIARADGTELLLVSVAKFPFVVEFSDATIGLSNWDPDTFCLLWGAFREQIVKFLHGHREEIDRRSRAPCHP